ncbi:internalin [Hyalangium minutum]|uniref:Internalin n=2 Tax=Hyalangium minutum TaxID=394096 RepID=A0A085VZU7_9BACT|nr:internalin [Hyalangium minutum]
MGSSVTSFRSVTSSLLTPLLLLGALSACGGPDPVSAEASVAASVEATASVPAEPRVGPHADALEQAWLLEPDSNVSWMLADMANLQVDIRDSADPIATTSGYQYIVDVLNLGPNPAAPNVQVVITLPSQIADFQANIISQPPGWGCAPSSASKVWTCTYYTPMAVNSPMSFTVSIPALGAENLLLLASATITSPTTDPTPGNNADSEETVVGVNDPPVITSPTAVQTAPEDTPIVFSAANGNRVSIADPDVFNRKLQVTLTHQGTPRGNYTLSQTTGLTFIQGDGTADVSMQFEGTLANINAALSGMIFTPSANYYGPAGLVVSVVDLGNSGLNGVQGASKIIRISVLPQVNDPPDAVDDTFQVPGDSVNYALNVLANDTYLPDPVETLTVTAVTQPANGTVTFTATGVSFTPTPGFRGTTTFTYTISDPDGATDTATVTCVVGQPNNPPTANNDSYTVAEDSAATTFFVLANDSTAPDTGESLTITAVTQPTGGTVTFTSGVVTFTPTANFFGTTTFTYTISDGHGGTATATVTVTVTGVNDNPTATNDTFAVLEDTPTTLDVLANDSSAPDGPETLTITAVTQPANGTVTVTGTNVLYTPPAEYSGTTTFTYTISDGNGGTATATVTVNVTAVNDPPVANADSITVAEDSGPTVVPVLANDNSGPETGETLTVTAVTQPTTGGAVTLIGGVVRFTPTANFFGTTTFTYTISDGNGGTATATVTVTVTPVNDNPDAVNDAFSVGANTGPNALDVLANDTYLPDAPETLTITAVTQPSTGGTVTFTPSGVTFTPTTNFRGTSTFTYTISDGHGGTDSATVTVTVGNNPPVANADTYTVLEDSGPTTFNVLANDTTAPDTGETLTITATTTPANGSVTNTGTSLSFRPAANFFGTTTFTYTISDGNGGTATATVTVTVTPVNDPPDAVNDSYSVARNSPPTVFDVLANDTFAPDLGESLTITTVTQPANGTVMFTAANVSFTPAANFVGTTSFTYTISDGNGGQDTAAVTVTVTPGNAPPDAVDDVFSVPEDSPVTTLDVLANDTTAPDIGETLSVTAVTQPATGGSVTFNASNVRFTPTANFNGTVTFTYTVTDGNGLFDTATVTVNVTSVNDPPDAVNDSFTVAESSGPTTFDVLANDTTAPDIGETLTVTSVTQPANGTVTLTGGVVSFTPATGFNGTMTFTYTVSDGNGGSDTAVVTVTVTPVNDPPTANDDSYAVLEDSSANAFSVLVNDSTAPDVGETLTITAVTQPANGTVTFNANTVFFTPAANFFGITTFTYTASDGNGGTDTATVTVTVDPVNDPPTANNDTLTVAEDSGATMVDVLANDSIAPDTGETLSVTAVTQPANGTVTLIGGVVRFMPAPNFNGTTTFTYTVRDSSGGTATATVTVTVTPVNDPPLATNDSFTVAEDSGATTFDVLANDTTNGDLGETLTITAVTQPANGTVTFTAGNVTFTPAPDYFGTTTFTYTISDGNGGTATATVTVTVTPVNEPPDAVNDSYTVLEDSGATTFDVLANDTFAPDVGETLTVTAVTQPANGSTTFSATGVRFTPAANFNGTTTFTYTITDGNGSYDTATVTVTVTPVNDPPTATDDTFTVAEDSTATAFNVLANDSIAPDTGETLTITSVTQPANGTVTFTASNVSFTPAANFNGTTSFTYRISDGNGGTATATVTVTVTPVNDPPDAVNDSYTVAEDSAATTFNVLANDTFAPDVGETLTITSVTQPAGGTVTHTASNVSFTPTANFNGTTTFTYTLSDGNGGSDTATVTVTVTPVNDPPTANNDSFTVGQNSGPTALNVLANDTAVPDTGETLTITTVTQPATGGSVSFTGSSVTFTPNNAFVGTTTFTYTISDGNGGTATATVTVIVNDENDPPDAVDDSFTVDEDSGPTVLDVLANDTFAPDVGETLSVTAVTQPANGTVTFTATGVTFTPGPNFNGVVTFSYTISDGRGGTDTASVTVNVTPVNDPPDAVDDSFTVGEDSASTVFNVLANDSTGPETTETLTITAVTQPTGGTVTMTQFNVSFTPAPNFNGTTTFTYTVSDGNGGTDTATVTVTVTPVNDPPDAVDDTFVVAESSPATPLDVLANDTTAPDTGETLSVTAVTQPVVGGTVTLAGGVVSFTPTPGFNGTSTFSYTVSDGTTTDTATVTVTVTPVNDPPTASDDTFTVPEDIVATTLDVLANDTTAPDVGETLTITAVTQPANGTVTLTGNVVEFTPTANFNGTTTFSYTVSDGTSTDTAQVLVTVTPVNDPPDANDDSFTVAEDSGSTVLNVLANDTIAPDTGETLTISSATQPAGGSVSFSGATLNFTPDANFNGTTSFTYRISDGNGGTDSATVTVTVTPSNDDPTASDDTFTVTEDSGATAMDVLFNDSSLPDDNETLTITAVTQPANGSVTFTATGVTFTPAANFFGTTSFTYSINDGNGGNDTATVTVNVTPVNDNPTANNDTSQVPADSGPTVINVLANDTIVPDVGETLTIIAVTQPANGTVSFTGANVTFTPSAGFVGVTTFTYRISDGNGGTATATVTVLVGSNNRPPVANDDSYTVAEDSGPSTFNVLANDTTAPDIGETLSVTAVTPPASGSVTFTATGVTFTPAANFNGTVSFTYTVSDGNGGTATATVTVTVTPVNDPPEANDDTFSVAEDSLPAVLSVLANDTLGPDTGETLTVTAVTQPATGGAVTLSGGVVRFTPAPNFNGTVMFTYTVSDGNGGTDTATVTVTVTPVNDPPDAVDDVLTVAEDSLATTVNVLANDTFAPDTGETLTVTAVTQPAVGGTAVANTTTSVSFTPAPNFNGTTTFTYTISDGNGGTDTATVTVTVTPVNDNPDARDDNFTVAVNSSARVLDVLFNDTIAPDTNETLTITAVTQPANGTVTFTATGVSFTPAAGFSGTTTFTYTISDGNGGTDTATVTVTVSGANRPPVANDDNYTVAEDSGATVLDVLANDTTAPDTGETLTITAVTQPATGGSVTFTSSNVSFTPAPNYNGTVTFSYAISDGNGGTDTAIVTVTVTAVPDCDAVDDTFTVAEDSGSTALNVTANDQCDTPVITAVTQPSSGTVTLSGGVVRFTPLSNFDGTVTFTYTLSDGGTASDTAVVTVTVTPVNDPPTANDDSFSTTEDYPLTVVNVLGNDTALPDTGETLTVTAVTQPANGTVTLSGGLVRFAPAPNFFGTTTFTYTISDGHGGTDSATVTMTVDPANDPPDAVNDSFMVAVDSSNTPLDVLLNDTYLPDAPETLTITQITQSANGSVTLIDGVVRFTPTPGYSGVTTFTYTLSDGNGGTDTATVTVSVFGTNNPPDAVEDSFTVDEDSGATTFDVLANDTFAPDTGETLTVTAVSQPAHGTVTLTGGVVSFTPAPNFNGTTTFTYTLSDGNNGTDSARVTVTVTPVNDNPDAVDDSFEVVVNSPPRVLDVLANDRIAPDVGETLTVTAVTQPANGTVTLTGGVVSFTPAAGFNGTTTFTYTISDGNGGTDTATVTVRVAGSNNPPTARDDSFTVSRNSPATVLNVLANDSTEPDVGETLTVTAVTQPATGGSVSLSGGLVRFQPTTGFAGTVSFSYTIEDGNGGTATATVTVVVTETNNPPDARNDTFSVAEDSTDNPLDVLANDTTTPDVGETLAVTAVTQPATGGSVTLTNTGTVLFTPTANFNGTTTFTYTVNDGNNGTDTATVTVTVTPVNDPPDAVNDSFSVAQDSGATVLDVLANDTFAPDVGETLTVTAVTQPAPSGTVTLSGGVVSFTPAAGFVGTTTFTYTLSDGNGGTDTATVAVRVGMAPNNPPDAVNDTFSVAEDSTDNVLDVLANDTAFPDAGETLTVTAVTQPATGGTVTLTGGVVTFTPTANFNGTVTFDYSISDGNGGNDTAAVAVTVTPVNDNPDAVDDVFNVAADSGATVLDVLANDTFAPDTGETLTVTAVTQPANGTVTLTGGVVSFTPAAGFSGITTFDYTISDGNGGTDTASVRVRVGLPPNNPPDAADDTFSVAEDSVDNVLAVLDNDTFAPDTGETLTVTSVTQPTSGGTVKLDNGVVTFTPTPNFNGDVTFTYTIDDGNGGTDTATVTVTVTPVNDDPVALDDMFTVPFNSTGNRLDVLANDSIAPDTGETLTVTAVTSSAPSGTVKVATDGSAVQFTPAEGFTGDVTFEYTISDGNGGTDTATVTVRVVQGNDTDGDGIPDEIENGTCTSPLDEDSDDDGLKDGDEDKNHDGHRDADETDPCNPDTDGGGATDGEEVEGKTNPLDDTDDFLFVGGGCASTGTSFVPLLLLLGLPLLRRRRAAVKASAAGAWGLLGVLAVFLTAPAHAQTTSSTASTKIDVQQFKPGPGAYDVLGLHSPKVNKHLGWNAGLSVNYATDPLSVLDPRKDAVVYKLVSSQLTVDVMAAIAFLDRFELGLAIPITSQSSESAPEGVPDFSEGAGKTGLGDLRLVPKANLFSAGGLSLGAALPLHLPTGGENFLGGGFSVRPKLLGEWNSSTGIRVLANVGMNLRSEQELRGLVVGNELTYGLGGEVPFQVSGRGLSVGATLVGAMGLGQKGSEEKPLELLATVKYRVTDSLAAHLGGGPGLSQGYGTPGIRVFAGLAYVAPTSRSEQPAPKVEAKPVPPPEVVADPNIKTKVEVIPPSKPVCALGPEDMDGFQDEDGCADPDNDNDGILDTADKCPNEPETLNGFQDEDGCPDVLPPADTDGDGITDDKDRCPQAAEDKDGFQDEDGCPDPDNDHDGVADADDKCPTEPETINGVKDEDGCPDKGKVKVLVAGEKVVILDKIFFLNNKNTILPKSFPLLRQVSQVLKANPQIELVRVEGHTDDKGEDGANLVLSRNRAEAVRDRLVLEGVEASRLEAVGYGEAKPIASNKTNKGREQNRRVDFTIVKVKPKVIEIEQP